jgi:hypothetical protein
MERDIAKVIALQEEYVKGQEIDKAFLCQDMLRELETTGTISPLTAGKAQKMGIALAAGRFA